MKENTVFVFTEELVNQFDKNENNSYELVYLACLELIAADYTSGTDAYKTIKTSWKACLDSNTVKRVFTLTVKGAPVDQIISDAVSYRKERNENAKVAWQAAKEAKAAAAEEAAAAKAKAAAAAAAAAEVKAAAAKVASEERTKVATAERVAVAKATAAALADSLGLNEEEKAAMIAAAETLEIVTTDAAIQREIDHAASLSKSDDGDDGDDKELVKAPCNISEMDKASLAAFVVAELGRISCVPQNEMRAEVQKLAELLK